jgi:hypothetical protein
VALETRQLLRETLVVEAAGRENVHTPLSPALAPSTISAMAASMSSIAIPAAC